ncbi:hypothetical protein NPIL_217641 [Nephila pilipes]|uniref:Uncharacterized protein n=1 Tax=Nephila pilipes TaxID=299642 RepID=A0A8X6T7W0_NEPPI|nr:hypothetical protein NPIL_217641 [Nephila pilipes]
MQKEEHVINAYLCTVISAYHTYYEYEGLEKFVFEYKRERHQLLHNTPPKLFPFPDSPENPSLSHPTLHFIREKIPGLLRKGLKDLPDIIWESKIPGIPQREGIPELISHLGASGRKS